MQRLSIADGTEGRRTGGFGRAKSFIMRFLSPFLADYSSGGLAHSRKRWTTWRGRTSRFTALWRQ